MAKVNVKPTDRIVVDVNMHQIDYNDEKLKSLRKEVANKYGIPLKNVEVNFVPVTKLDSGEEVTLTSDIIDNIQDPQFQQKLFEEYLKIKNYDDINIDDIKAIDAQVNAHVDFDQYSKFKQYKFKYVKWDNFASYGSGNYFDFTKLNGLVLLNGYPENQSGKTTFAIDLLRFALFGKSKKTPTLDSVFNIYKPEETEVVVEACLEIEGNDYVIRRTVKRPALKKRTARSKCTQSIEYYKVINGNFELIENCNEESTTKTNNIIRETIGSVDDFNLVISATSKTLADLLDMGQTEKGKLFSKWLGLLSIETKEDIAKKLWKEINVRLLSNTYNKETIKNEISDYGVSNKDYDAKILASKEKLNTTNETINNYNKEKVDILSNRKQIKEELIKADIATIEAKLKSNNDGLATKRAEMSKGKERYAQIKDVQFNEEELTEVRAQIKEKTEKKNELVNKNVEIKTKISHQRAEIKKINELIAKKTCPECGQPIDLGLQNGKIEKIELDINRLIANGTENKTKIDKIDADVKKLEEKVAELENNRKLLNELNLLKSKLSAIKVNIDNYKLVIANLEAQKNDIETNKENIAYNNAIDIKINNLDVKILAETKVRDQILMDIQSYTNSITYNNTEVAKREELMKKLVSEEKIIRNWNVYLELVGKNGIVKLVLKQALPILNNEMNRILNGLCDFSVVLDINEKNNVTIDLYRAGIKLDLGAGSSGFESVMSSLALRSALASMSSIAKPNMMVLDEVLDGVAVCNYDNVKELFNRIVKNYDFIIHITHNEFISDWHNMNITVTKDEDLVSHITLK